MKSLKAVLWTVLLGMGLSLSVAAQSQEKLEKKAETPPAQPKPAAQEIKKDAAPPAKEESKPVPSDEPKKIEEKSPAPTPEPEAKPFGCVIHLKDLIGFHEKEIASLKRTIERWNEKVGAAMKRRQDLENESLSISKEIDELGKTDDKKAKKEIARLTKQIGRLNKDIKAVGKELKTQCKELAGEVKEVAKESQGALKEKFQQVLKDIQDTGNGM